jgi:hypothetical protein
LHLSGSSALPVQMGPCDAPELICKAALNQGHSLYIRDRCRYEQRLKMERFKYDKRRQAVGERIALRLTTVVVEPAPEPDETGNIPVLTRVIADTNDVGVPKTHVDPKAPTGLTSGALLDTIFFPLLPENLQYLQFEETPAETEGERWYRFSPRIDVVADRPLASGIAQLDAKTGEVLTIRVDAMSNLIKLDERLDKLRSLTAIVDFSQYGGKYRLPAAANGSGVSEVSRFNGFFKFVFEEGKYVPVMKLD